MTRTLVAPSRPPAWLALVALAALPACTFYFGGDDDGDDDYEPPIEWYPDGSYQVDAGYPPPDAGSEPDARADGGPRPSPGQYDFVYFDAVDSGQGRTVRLGSVDGASSQLAGPYSSLDALSVSPTGRHVAFGSFEDGWKLRVKSLTDRSERVVGTGEAVPVAAWSPDGTQLVYESRTFETVSVIRAAVDGSSVETLVTTAAQATAFGCAAPQYSPDGREIAYVIGGAVEVRTVATGAVRTVVSGLGTACNPIWSPSGRVLAFTYSNAAPGSYLALVGARGGPMRSLTDLYFYATDVVPHWTADGLTITYVDWEAPLTSPALKRIAVAGGEPEVVTTQVDSDSAAGPAWAPDHGSILLSSYAGQPELALWDATTGAVRGLGIYPFGWGLAAPTWLPAPLTLP